MQWSGPSFGFRGDEPGFVFSTPGAAAEPIRRLRCAWIRALVERGEYDRPDVLEDVLDAMQRS